MPRTVWNRFFIGMALITSVALLIWIAGASAVAQNTYSGEWTATVSTKENSKIHLNLERKSAKHGRNQMGQSFEFSELQGLTREQAINGGPVSFSLVREAGRIDLEGSFQNGKGSGTFRFTGNPSFISAMKSRGFDFDSNQDDEDRDPESRLFAATTLNVTTALADDLNSAGLGKLQVEDLFKAAIFKVDGKFAREMKDSGFQNLTFDDLVKARIFKIDAEFVKDVAAKGFQNEPFESLVKMRIFKITPEFITEVRNEGFQNIEIEQLVKFKIFNINAEFIRQARSEGVPMEVEKLVQKRIGVYRVRKDDN